MQDSLVPWMPYVPLVVLLLIVDLWLSGQVLIGEVLQVEASYGEIHPQPLRDYHITLAMNHLLLPGLDHLWLCGQALISKVLEVESSVGEIHPQPLLASDGIPTVNYLPLPTSVPPLGFMSSPLAFTSSLSPSACSSIS